MMPLQQLGAYVADGVRISDPLREAIKLHVIDTVAAWIATAATSEARLLRDFRDAMRKNCADSDPSLDVLVNCALARLSEIDDIHLASMTTPGSIVIPGALTIAAKLRADTEVLCEAIVAGYEVIIRLGMALDGPKILYRGIWPTYLAAPFGIAAVAARLLALNSEQSAHALAIALSLAAPGAGQQKTSTGARWFAIGNAARNGLLAARAARSGFTGDLAIADSGFFAGIYDVAPSGTALTQGLGQRANLMQVSFKPWCAARQTMAAAQALREIIAGGVACENITAIEVSVPPPFLKMVAHGIAGDRISRLTSQPYQLAIAALAPDAAFDIGQTAEVPQSVRVLMDKITVQADAALLDVFPKQWPARVRVRTKTAQHERLVVEIPGDPGRPYDEQQVREKFLRLARDCIGESAGEAIIAASVDVLSGKRSPADLLAQIARVHA